MYEYVGLYHTVAAFWHNKI